MTMRGKRHTKATRERMREAHVGKKLTNEHKRRIGAGARRVAAERRERDAKLAAYERAEAAS